MPQPLPRSKQFVFITILILTSLAFLLIAAEKILRYRRHQIQNSNQRDSGMIVYDATLGWKLTKFWTGNHRHYDFDVKYVTNEYGFRGEFRKKQSDSDRIYAFVGDSFTFSYGVNEGETFVDRLNQVKKREGMIFYNFGVPGYSTDQELLLIKERVFTFEPDIIFLVIYLHNDLIDNEYPFPIQSRHGKPYFEITPSGIELKNTPVPQQLRDPKQLSLDLASMVLGASRPAKGFLARHARRLELTRWIIPHLRRPSDLTEQFESRLAKNFRLFYAITDHLKEECRKRNVTLRLVLMPGKSFVESPESVSAQFQNYLRKRLLEQSHTQDLTILDLAGHLRDHYEREGTKLYHPSEGHMNPEGHRIAALLLLRLQAFNGLIDATSAFQWDETINPGGSSQISKDKQIRVPEPSTMFLLGNSRISLGAFRKKFKN